jgi:hypothetical protein
MRAVLQIPKTGTPLIVGEDVNRAWRDYLAGIETVSRRVTTAQPNSAAVTLATLVADHNALLARLRAAGLMEV